MSHTGSRLSQLALRCLMHLWCSCTASGSVFAAAGSEKPSWGQQDVDYAAASRENLG